MAQGKRISSDIHGDESGESGVAIGHVLGLLARYGIATKLQGAAQ